MQITIYTKTNCPNCITAKHLLGAKGLEYTEHDSEQEPHFSFVTSQGLRQMPQIYIDGQRVGGLTGLVEALKQLGL